MPRLDLVAGPNGAGKSTFIFRHLAPLLPGSVLVNADEIARARWPDNPETHAYEAARIAAATRATLIEQRVSFIAETVFSHPSKLALIDDAQQAGYRVLMRVVMVPEDLTVERVRLRVAAGGHNVPEQKIRERYQRVWPLLIDAARRVNLAAFYDNSRRTGHVEVARMIDGQLIAANWPTWTPAALSDAFPE